MTDDEGPPRMVHEPIIVDGPLPPLEEKGPAVLVEVDPFVMALAVFAGVVLGCGAALAEALDSEKGRKS